MSSGKACKAQKTYFWPKERNRSNEPFKVKRISDGGIYALKKVKMGNLSVKEKENALNEVRILASIKSPYVAGYKQAFFDEQSSSLW